MMMMMMMMMKMMMMMMPARPCDGFVARPADSRSIEDQEWSNLTAEEHSVLSRNKRVLVSMVPQRAPSYEVKGPLLLIAKTLGSWAVLGTKKTICTRSLIDVLTSPAPLLWRSGLQA